MHNPRCGQLSYRFIGLFALIDLFSALTLRLPLALAFTATNSYDHDLATLAHSTDYVFRIRVRLTLTSNWHGLILTSYSKM